MNEAAAARWAHIHDQLVILQALIRQDKVHAVGRAKQRPHTTGARRSSLRCTTATTPC